jgi:N-acetylneuraminic acid mutarotase
MQVARAGHAVEAVDGRIVAVSGFDSQGELLQSVEARRTGGSGVWQEIAPIPTARANHGTAVVNGLVYAVGGFGADDVPLASVEVFNPKTGRWTASTPLPVARAAVSAAALNGLLYVAGGVTGPPDNQVLQSSVVAYDPASRTWRSVAPMSAPRGQHRLVASGRHLYALGGFDVLDQSVATVERYDPGTDTWTAIGSMRESRVLPCAAVTEVRGRDVVVVAAGARFGPGMNPLGQSRTTEVLDVKTGRWTLLSAQLPFPNASVGCAAKPDGTVIATGGHPGDSVVRDVFALKLQHGHG